MIISPSEAVAAGPAVLVDCASAVVQVAALEPDGGVRWARSESEAGLGLFACLEDLSIEPLKVGAWIYCRGPGSILGIRTAAMALRTWRVLRPAPVYAYFSLEVVARARGENRMPVIADARRDSWHVFTMDEGLRRVPSADVAVACAMPEGFRHWTKPPPGTELVSYDLRDLLPRVWHERLLSPCGEPDAFLHEEPNYVTWTPRIHRAPDTR